MIISIVFSIVLFNLSSNEINRGLGRQENRFMMLNIPPNNPLQNLQNIRNEQLEESSRHLKTNLIYFNFLILILSSGVSYFFAKRTLKPIEDMLLLQNNFTADASHELRTPLTVLRSEIEVGLRDKKLSLNDAKQLLNSNLEEIIKIEDLSNTLLKLSKYQEKNKLEFRKINLEEVLVEAYEKVESIANNKNIKFKTSLNNLYVNGDKISLVELFVILLENAIKYSPEKSEIKIGLSSEKKETIVKIIDQGIGIKEVDLPHIFDRFYRADHSRNKEHSNGYGLGLSIAKRIVDLHNGKISVESEPSKGTTCIVKFTK